MRLKLCYKDFIKFLLNYDRFFRICHISSKTTKGVFIPKSYGHLNEKTPSTIKRRLKSDFKPDYFYKVLKIDPLSYAILNEIQLNMVEIKKNTIEFSYEVLL